MIDFLFYIFIYPLQLILEIIFSVLYTSVFKGNIGIALAGLSLAVSVCCLPMYEKAEKIQQNERDIQKRLAAKIALIKKNFTGDEQYFILSAYYRENKYHPLYSLRSSLSLLLQIPFFIAAYTFLKHLDVLAGKSFFIFSDLSKPDGLLNIGGFCLNILPFIMTLINLTGGIIYSNDLLKKEKIQLYLTPLIFLVLLYNSPSALVIYWTLNNIFSLFKTLFHKFNFSKKLIYYFGVLCAALFAIYVIFIRFNAPERAFRNKAIAFLLFLFFLSLPFIYKFIRFIISKFKNVQFEQKYISRIFICSIISIWLLVGFFVPANIISSDPSQFSNINSIINPLNFLYFPLVQGAGLLILWPFILFSMFPNKIKIILSLLAASLSLSFFGNYFIFNANYGIISQTLNFSLISGQYLAKGISFQIINILFFLILTGAIIFLFIKKKNYWMYTFLIFLSLGTFAYGSVKFAEISVYNKNISLLPLPPPINEKNDIIAENNYSIKLSKNGKNVFVVMLDGAVSSYFPLLLKQRPELPDSYNGFTYFPNTASLFRRTMFGAPPIFGGYEYTSYNMEKQRSDVLIADKQVEAVSLLPLIFKNSGYNSTVSDIIDNGFFKETQEKHFTDIGIETNNIERNFKTKYLNEVLDGNEIVSKARIDELIKRNLLMLSFTVTVPYSFRDFLYINGKFWSTKDYQLDTAISDSTINSYTSLYYFPKITSITSEEENIFHIIVSNITHNHVFFQYPDYSLETEINYYGENIFNSSNSFKAFHVNAAAFILLSKWFNHLRESGVWDNTRIIIVSDHGDSGLDNPEFSAFQNNYVLSLNSLLMIKDFNQNEPLSVNNNFMTSADVPMLALNGIIENPVNPFTNKVLTTEKSEGIYIYTQGFTNAKWYQGTSFLNDNSTFLHVKENIFDKNNWTELKYKDFKNN